MKIEFADTFWDSFDRCFSWKYAPLRFWNKITNIPNTLEHYWQRVTRGYSYQDVWSLDWFIDSWMPQAMRELRDKSCGVPSHLCYDPKTKKEISVEEGSKIWNQILTDIADGFEAHRILANLDYDFKDKKAEKELERKFKKGMKLFSKHYGSFWW